LSFTGNTLDALEIFDVVVTGTSVGSGTGFIVNTDSNGASGFTEGSTALSVLSGTTTDPLSGNTYVVVNNSWVLQTGHEYIRDVRENFIFQTQLNYSGNKQVLSTPFLFYFGLTPQKTSLDKLIKHFGPKGAFTSAE